MKPIQRLHPSAGIAIGPILFVIALLAVLASVMAAGNDGFQIASGADRITADIVSQANLIRNTINECNIQYTLDVSNNSINPTSDPFPNGTSVGTATLVSALNCDPDPQGAASLWNTKTSTILLPPPTSGFNPWMYIDASGSGGGRCIWASPSMANPASNQQVTVGLTRAASKFNSGASYSATTEVLYDPTSTSQKFIVWITQPTGTANNNCLP